MTYDIETLNKLDSSKLMDIVKNYRQYGLDASVRTNAISILSERGISTEHLAMTGNLVNHVYESADELYRSFNRNSMIAFISYIVLILVNVLNKISTWSESMLLGIVLFAMITALVYFIHLIKSFLNQDKFYKAAGDNYGAGGALVYFFFGLPLYIFAFFLFRSQMKDKMKEIK